MSDTVAVIIPAAGFGRRMGCETAKQFIEVGGKSILSHTVGKFLAWSKVYNHHIHIIVALSDVSLCPEDINDVDTCVGGDNRADSVANAMQELHRVGDFEWVMVHDAARPLVLIDDIEKLYQSLRYDDVGGILAEKITATVKRGSQQGIIETIPRDTLWLAQTPQFFRFSLLQQSLDGSREGLTDEASGIEKMGLAPKIIEGSRNNIKITTPEDLCFFENMLGVNS